METTDKTDERRWSELMASAQSGNQQDYRQLLQELGNAIAAYLRARFGNFNALEDCVQESLIAIHDARHTYEPARLFRPWLFAIVRHKTIDFFRRKQAYDTMLNQHRHPAASHNNTQPGADTDISSAQLLALLPVQHREALLLTKLQGFSISEAASQLNISESAMKVRIHRALQKARKLLEAEFL